MGGIVGFFAVIQESYTMYIMCGAILLLALIIAACALRCPKCGKCVPDRFTMKFDYCPHCGEKI